MYYLPDRVIIRKNIIGHCMDNILYCWGIVLLFLKKYYCFGEIE